MKQFISIKRLMALCSATLLLLACNQEEKPDFERVEQTVPITFNADADGLELELNLPSDDPRALTYDFEANKGKDYPKPVLKFMDGQKVPVVIVVQRVGVRDTKFIAQTEWTYEAPRKPDGSPLYPNVAYTSGGRIYIKNKKINAQIPTQPKKGEDNWKMLCIVGGTHEKVSVRKQDRFGRIIRTTEERIKFKNLTPAVINAQDKEVDLRDLNTIYMNEEWADLEVTEFPSPTTQNPNATTPVFSTKKRVRLRNQGVTFLIRATNHFNKDIPLRGFRLAADNLGFEGYYDLNELEGYGKPSFNVSRHVGYARPPRMKEGNTTRPYGQWLGTGEQSHFFVCTAMPEGKNEFTKTTKQVDGQTVEVYTSNSRSLSMHVSPLLGDRYEVEGKLNKFLKRSFRYGSFISLKSIEAYQRDLRHPIESFLMDEETGILFRQENIDYDDALNDHNFAAIKAHGEAGRDFAMPSEAQLRILVPNMRKGESTSNLGTGSVPILNMGPDFAGKKRNDISSWDTKTNDAWDIKLSGFKRITYLPEEIEAFGTKANYDAQYSLTKHAPAPNPFNESNPSTPAYGLRFIGHPDYFSAYRYQVVMKDGKKMLEIRVRELGRERRRTTINQIANEDYWNSDPAWDQREIVRYVPAGRYWSTTSYKRAATPGGFGDGNQGAASVAKILLNKGEDNQTTYPWGAYVTDYSRLAWMENPRVKANQVNSGFALVTDQKSAVQGRSN